MRRSATFGQPADRTRDLAKRPLFPLRSCARALSLSASPCFEGLGSMSHPDLHPASSFKLVMCLVMQLGRAAPVVAGIVTCLLYASQGLVRSFSLDHSTSISLACCLASHASLSLTRGDRRLVTRRMGAAARGRRDADPLALPDAAHSFRDLAPLPPGIRTGAQTLHQSHALL